jgi:predicted small lipoprotein YifL
MDSDDNNTTLTDLRMKGVMAMKKFVPSVIAALMMIVLIISLSGCAKEGPIEKAGKKVDKAIEKAGEQIEKAGEKVKDAIK